MSIYVIISSLFAIIKQNYKVISPLEWSSNDKNMVLLNNSIS